MSRSDRAELPAEVRVARGNRPLVAIVGRPNVGKSTLFNRLVGKHLAIVQDEPGVTRDRHFADAEVRGRAYVLVDTGGFEHDAKDAMMSGVRDQVKLAVAEADLVIFVADGTVPLTEADHEALKLLRKAGRPVIYLANKADSASRAMEAMELYRAGADQVIAVSALHGRGLIELDAALEKLMPEDTAEDVPLDENVARVAVVGRPNAGKSSLINKLIGSERLLVTDVPGTTRDAIDTLVTKGDKQYVFVDTAGIRRKRSVSAPVEMTSVMQAIRAMERCDVVVVLLDVTENLSDQDLRLISLAEERGRAVILGLNKVDKVDMATERKAVAEAHRKLTFAPWIPILKMSAKAGRGTSNLLAMVDRAWESHGKRIGTGEVNRFFEEVITKHPPPVHAGRSPRIYYISQVGTHPPRFAAVVNYIEAMAESYARYMQNQLRERFGFEAVPVRVSFRAKRKRDDLSGPPKPSMQANKPRRGG
ncbi:MAG: ribosome biogenesis GTPase Der [Deltaproteobacteria bacterium]|nr:ribosome biogenesis GTPase Der [Myxococcales bacterium]MDP3215958.1 ribosome biogenesis GTPase Der [Deltaproteobacteria bacterium]